MIEQIDKILRLNVTLIGSNCYHTINVEYFIDDAILKKHPMYEPNYKITFDKLDYHSDKIDLHKMSDKQIKDFLKSFSCTQDDVKKFINIRDHGNIDKLKTVYYFDTDLVKNKLNPILDDIILYHKEDTLTLSQKKALRNEYENEIDFDTYKHLSEEEKEFYYIGYSNIAEGYKLIEFLNSFITKNDKYIHECSFNCHLKLQSDDILNEIYISIDKDTVFLDKYININKPCNININVTAIPLTELSPLCERIFKSFNEDKFISNLQPELIKNLKNNIKTLCVFEQTRETKETIAKLKDLAKNDIINNRPISLTEDQRYLIKQPKYITTDIPPKGYVITKTKYLQVNKDYNEKLKNYNYNKTSVKDMIFIMNLITNIKIS